MGSDRTYLGSVPWHDLHIGDKVESWQGRIGTITKLDDEHDQQIEIFWNTPIEDAPTHSNPYYNHQVEAYEKKLYYAMLYWGRATTN